MSSLELQFAIAEVPEVPRAVQFVRGPEWGSEILSDGVYKVSSTVGFEGTVRRTGNNLLLELEVTLPVEFLCSRCGDEVRQDYIQSINHLFVQGNGDEISIPLDVDLDPELDITEYVGNQCDAEAAVLGALAADLPVYPQCEAGCNVPTSGAKKPTKEEPTIDPRLAPLLAIRESMTKDSSVASTEV